jgi:UDP-N-acetylglucosamine 2-epimerase (non-hydrolysing)
MHVLQVVGARPNFMKAAPVLDALNRKPDIKQTLVHTGQHYDANMSDVFFKQLGLPRPDVSLDVGSGSHAVQTARIMMKFESTLLKRQPDMVLVYGDVNSTAASAMVCAKLGIPVGHVEAGLRSFDRTMPEEVNRLITDQLSDLLFTPSADADANLLHEGIWLEKIHRVGNVMIDTVVRLLPQARMPDIKGLSTDGYILVTLHRPSNVDDPGMLLQLLRALGEISKQCQVVFPVHPRTRKRIERFQSFQSQQKNILLTEPLGYLEFLALQHNSEMVITDSGGIQEETTYLGVPCLTLRENTERPVTVDVGTNRLIGSDLKLLKREVEKVLAGFTEPGGIPDLWDGHAGDRVAEILTDSAIVPRSVTHKAA